MNHELRTPLSAIVGYAELLELGIRGVVNAEQTRDLGRIKQAAAYLLRLINDVLTVARLGEERPLKLITIGVDLLNLVTNSIKFTKKGGSISITCDSDANMARLRVRDTGVGVRTADIERVFEAFVQVDRHLTAASQQGVGLGLSISRGFALSMHGDLTLRSIEGVGSTFTLTLPIAPETLLADSTPAAMAAAGSSA